MLDIVFREEHGRILAHLIGFLGDFQFAEDVLQDAFVAALTVWPSQGVPANPGAWLTVTARRKAIDRLRRAALASGKLEQFSNNPDLASEEGGVETHTIADDRLRLIFTCCHPAIALEARIALTLRTVGGLTTPEIAKAFLLPEVTLAQRLVRAKKKINIAGIPYQVPPDHLLTERLDGVLSVLYLIFNEGYGRSSGEGLLRHDLAAEAIRLARLLMLLMPDEPEVQALLALMLLHDSRRAARVDGQGEIILLDFQDRKLWDC